LYSWGLFKKDATLTILGLDNAGKTTLLYYLKNGSIRQFIPTQRAKMDEVDVGRVKFRAWDVGGHDSVRSLWQEYYVTSDAIIFMVDSADIERLPEAKKELMALLDDTSAPQSPIAVIANKIDIPSALPPEKLIVELGLDSRKQQLNRPIEVFRCSLILGVGYKEALNWLSSLL